MSLEGYVHLSCGSPVQRTGLRSGGERTAVARGVRGSALLGSRRPGAGATGDDRVSASSAATPGALARSARTSDGFPADGRASGEAVSSARVVASPSTTRARPERTSLPSSALEAVSTRSSVVLLETHQSLDHQRLWADLLSSEAMAFNLFGGFADDLEARRPRRPCIGGRKRAAWCSDVRFAHSPGRLDPAYLGSLRAFDVAFVLDLGDGTQGVVGVDVKYHEWLKPETPKPSNLWRYLEVAERSGAFGPGAVDALKGKTGLCVMWLEHLLLLSMLQHASGTWTWGHYVIVHPAGNTDFEEACSALPSAPRRPGDLLVRDTSRSSWRPTSSRYRPPQPCAIGTYPTETGSSQVIRLSEPSVLSLERPYVSDSCQIRVTTVGASRRMR